MHSHTVLSCWKVSLGSWAVSLMDRSEMGDNSWMEVTLFLKQNHILKINGNVPLWDEYIHSNYQQNTFPERALQTTECTTMGSLILCRKYTSSSLHASSQPSSPVSRRAFAPRSGGRPQSHLGTKSTGRGSCRHQQERATPRGSPGADLETPVCYARIMHLQSFWRHMPSCMSSIIPPCLHDQVDDTNMWGITVFHTPPLYRTPITAAETSRLLLMTALCLPFSFFLGRIWKLMSWAWQT